MKKLGIIALVMGSHLLMQGGVAEAKRPAPETVTAVAPYGGAFESVARCTSTDVCSSDVDLTTGTINSRLIVNSTDGSTRQYGMSQGFQDFLEVSRVRELTITVTVQVEQADATTTALGGGTGSSSIRASMLVWQPQMWTASSGPTLLTSSANGANGSVAPGEMTLTFVHRPGDFSTPGRVGVEVSFEETASASSAAGGAASAGATLRVTVTSISITF